jgi:hypothetical protein
MREKQSDDLLLQNNEMMSIASDFNLGRESEARKSL